MKPLRIFISSPGDVAEERDKARQVIAQLQKTYRALKLQPVLWEDMPLHFAQTFQQGIETILEYQGGIDIAIFILWSRLGSPLGESVLREDGTPYRSGTERELDLMLRAYQQSGGVRPHILAYVRKDQDGFLNAQRGKDSAGMAGMYEQLRLVEQFIEERVVNQQGHNLHAFTTFPEPATFAVRLKVHLKSILDEIVAKQGLAPATWEAEPYRGLRAFEYEHAPIFFGRDREIAEVQLALREQAKRGCAFVLIVGASGSGKSSLARAGVLPEIVEGNLEETILWRRAILTPGECAAEGLLHGLTRALSAPTALPNLCRDETSLAGLAEALGKDPALAWNLRLRDALDQASEGRQTARLLLLVDQLEEIFTHQVFDRAQVDSFVNALDVLARSGRVWVLATVRSDFFAACQQLPVLMAMKGKEGHFDLLPPQPSDIARIITEPARLAGVRFEKNETTGETLDQRLVNDALAHPEALPLLEFALGQLYERRSPEGLLTFEQYEALGGVEGALGRHAESAYLSLPEPVRPVFPRVLQSLVSIGETEDAAPVRRRAPLDQLTDTPEKREVTEKLIAERLLIADRGEVYVAHEALLRRWDRAVQWIEANREVIRMRDRIAARMAEGAPLTEADPLTSAARYQLARNPEVFSSEQRIYIERQLAQIRAESDKRRRIIGRSFVKPARQAVSSGLHDHALRLAGAATLLAEDVDGELVRELWPPALEAISRNRAVARLGGHTGKVNSATFSPNGARIVTASWDNTARVWDAASGALLASLEGHTDRVRSAAFSPDGARIVTASDDRTARVWDAASGALVANLEGHTGSVTSAAFSPDSAHIVTASDDRTARVWDASSGALVASLERHRGSVNTAAFSADGERIVTGAFRDMARVWDASSGALLASMEGDPGWGTAGADPDGVWTAAFSVDGACIVTASYDNRARVWEAGSGALVAILEGHTNRVESAAFSEDGARIVTASVDRTARVWDAQSGALLASLEGHTQEVNSAAFSPDGMRIVTASVDRTARVWDAQSGALLASLEGHMGSVTSAAFSPDGARIVTASDDKTARVWETLSGALEVSLARHNGGVNSAAFSPVGTRIVTASNDNTARVWDAQSGAQVASLQGHTNLVNSAAFSPDGTCIVTASCDNTARVWDAQSGTQVASLQGHTNLVNSAAFSPDGTCIVTASCDNTARVWDAASGAFVANLEGHTGSVTSAAFSPDSAHIVTASDDKTARVWDAGSGALLASLEGHTDEVRSAAFSPDGTRIVTASNDNTARVWDAGSGALLASLEGHTDRVRSAAFSPDGTCIVTASCDNTARVWDADSRALVASLEGHTGLVLSAAFSPDGTRIVTASNDNTARVWDAGSGALLASLEGHTHIVMNVAFSPDGLRVVTASEDHTVRIWDISRTAVIVRDPAVNLAAALACGIGRRTEEEAKDLLMQDAPEDMYAALLEKLGPERAAQVPAVAAALRAPLHPNCYLSPTQFAEKFGLPKPEATHETPETNSKEEEEKGDTLGGDVGGSTETAPEPETVPLPTEHSEDDPHPAIRDTHKLRRGVRPLTVLLMLGLGAILGALPLAALIATGLLDMDAIWQQLRSLLRQ